ncbi:MAG: F0F1 ATP synthase subunit delta [Treponema sp.]|jgi:ATP synthase F1 delta subunit|nr:F0F1 ATP synthase subunit delta [Treponema sp.]
MFHAGRWAGAFLSVSGKDAGEAFLCLKALSAQVKNVHGAFFGRGAEVKLEKILRESAAVLGEENPSVEYAIRFLCLLVEKKCFRNIEPLLQRIEQDINRQKGILDVTVESSALMDGSFEKELERMIKEKTGAENIKMKTRVRPELLGGYLLRIGGYYVDASLKGQLESMSAHLGGNANFFAGGRNG